jgi:hypothetical protein
LGLGRQIGQINSGAFGVFSAEFWCNESLVHVFHYSTIFSQKTKSLHPHPKYFWGLGFEFVPQKIRDLAFVNFCFPAQTEPFYRFFFQQQVI